MAAFPDQVAAYVLHVRPYRETSALVDLLTLEFGKISVVARGARRPGSQLRHTLQPFNALSIRFSGRSDLKTLNQAESVEVLPTLAGDALLCGLYANELLERLLHPAEPIPQLFLYYRYLLNELRSGASIEETLRIFEQKLLKELGIWVDLSGCSEAYYRYDAGLGLRVALDSSSAHYTGEQLRAIEIGEYTEATTKRAAKKLMRALIQEQLGDRPLRARELFKPRVREVTGDN